MNKRICLVIAAFAASTSFAIRTETAQGDSQTAGHPQTFEL